MALRRLDLVTFRFGSYVVWRRRLLDSGMVGLVIFVVVSDS